MSLDKKAQATAKNIEGKAQAAVGHVTGDPATRNAGKAKQAEAELRHTAANVEDKVQDGAASAQNRVEAAAKNVTGKIEEIVGDKTDDPARSVKGKAKQAQADAINAREDHR